MKGEIYVIFNKINSKPYVGITICGYKRRFRKHKDNARQGKDYALYRAMRKYGIENFWVDLLEAVEESSEEILLSSLNNKEIFWIKALDSKKNGYNMTSGGQGLLSPSKEVRKKISENMTISNEQCERLRKLRTGVPPWCKGKKMNKEFCEKISRSRKGWVPSEETREKWRNQRRGRKLTEETRRKMSETHKQRYNKEN